MHLLGEGRHSSFFTHLKSYKTAVSMVGAAILRDNRHQIYTAKGTKNPVLMGQLAKSRGQGFFLRYKFSVLSTKRIGHLHQKCKWPKNGGGGNRTRVPRRFCGSFYVRSRMFELRPSGPQPARCPMD